MARARPGRRPCTEHSLDHCELCKIITLIKSCMCTTQSIYTVLCINIYYNYNYKYKLLDSKHNLVFYVFNVSYLLQFATCIDCL